MNYSSANLKCFLIVAAVCLSFGIGGCANVEVKRVDYQKLKDDPIADHELQGVRYFSSEPYLLVSPTFDKESGNVTTYTTQVIYLPNYDEEYVVQVHPGWGVVNGSVSLANGWMLSSLGAQMDSKGPETITALTGVATAALAHISDLAPPSPKSTLKRETRLYHIGFRDHKIELTPAWSQPASDVGDQ